MGELFFAMTLPTPRADSAVVTQEVLELVRAETGIVDLSADSDLQSHGLDSVKVMSLIFKIEVRYDIHLEEEDADDLKTVGDLAKLVVRRIEELP